MSIMSKQNTQKINHRQFLVILKLKDKEKPYHQWEFIPILFRVYKAWKGDSPIIIKENYR